MDKGNLFYYIVSLCDVVAWAVFCCIGHATVGTIAALLIGIVTLAAVIGHNEGK